jgi:hypothetical protein
MRRMRVDHTTEHRRHRVFRIDGSLWSGTKRVRAGLRGIDALVPRCGHDGHSAEGSYGAIGRCCRDEHPIFLGHTSVD